MYYSNQNEILDEDNSKNIEKRKKKITKEVAETNVEDLETSDDEDNFCTLNEEQSDASEDIDEDENDSENTFDQDLEEDIQIDNLPITPEVEKFYIVEFRVKQLKRHYIGKFVEIIDNDNVFVKFLRRSKKISNKFIWPTIADEGIIRLEELVKGLTNPLMDRRHALVFKSNEIKAIK
ncbi:hypothetical protein NQ314_020511 [Rhamnusium bicolor]|uniref:Uncharacterized protein n=1 Tax=Rhamnusium bicolor TaxID=1586634 RepID=A0AAV8WLH3_9CUCU|nr:hypothetical protein NQ314_020511 [Rhamnusium bicolor]